VSRFVLKKFENEYNFSEPQMDCYILDLLNHRDISNEIAFRYNVPHQSPQVVVIRNGKAVYTDSHDGIDANDLKQFV
jgi:bacillithiol system protein YtxJ